MIGCFTFCIMRTCNTYVCLVAGERKEGGRRVGAERGGERGGQAAVIGKVKGQGACQGVTHAPEGPGDGRRASAAPAISFMSVVRDEIPGLVCVKTLFFISPLLTVKTARWSVDLSVIKCFLLKITRCQDECGLLK